MLWSSKNSKRERNLKILKMIDGGKTVSEIAKKFGISRNRVHQINQSKVFWDKKQKLYNAIKTSHYFFPEKSIEELADHFRMSGRAIDKILEDYYNDKD
jgi:Mor family transcriptional regulator